MLAMLPVIGNRIHSTTERHREQKRLRYLANREAILAKSKERWRERKAESAGATAPSDVMAGLADPDRVEDTRPIMDRDRREVMEGIRLRLIWASSAGGDEGAVAKAAVAVIRFAEGEGGRWTDKALRALHRRLTLAEGLTSERFEAARSAIARELFVPL